VRRRKFITLLSGAAVAWPLAARAQQPAMPVVGYLSVRSNDNYLTEALRRGLRETGYVEGQNVAFEFRWAMGQYDRMPAMASELARLPLAVLVTAGGEPAALAAKAATDTIPIVFAIGGDPARLGSWRATTGRAETPPEQAS
jgi:putative ABC transport system substrate-binding protein